MFDKYCTVEGSASNEFKPEASLFVTDFTIFVYGSSCNYVSCGLVIGSLLSLTICYSIPKAGRDAKNNMEKEKK